MLDFISITILILFFIRGYMKGIIVAVFSVLAVVLGAICALKFSGLLASWLLQRGWVTSGWGQVISYAILFVLVLLLVRLIANLIQKSMQAAMLGWINRITGGILYVTVAAIICSSFFWIGDQMHLFALETKTSSITFPFIEPIAPWVFEKMGALLPFAKNVFADLRVFFDHVDKTIPEHVGAH